MRRASVQRSGAYSAQAQQYSTGTHTQPRDIAVAGHGLARGHEKGLVTKSKLQKTPLPAYIPLCSLALAPAHSYHPPALGHTIPRARTFTSLLALACTLARGLLAG